MKQFLIQSNDVKGRDRNVLQEFSVKLPWNKKLIKAKRLNEFVFLLDNGDMYQTTMNRDVHDKFNDYYFHIPLSFKKINILE